MTTWNETANSQHLPYFESLKLVLEKTIKSSWSQADQLCQEQQFFSNRFAMILGNSMQKLGIFMFFSIYAPSPDF